jgi:hypothetical protein
MISELFKQFVGSAEVNTGGIKPPTPPKILTANAHEEEPNHLYMIIRRGQVTGWERIN